MTRWTSAAFAILTGIIILWPADGLPEGSVNPGPMSRAEAFARAEALTALGRKMFFDPSLSASGKQACSSCHDPNHAFGPTSASPVEMGGPNLDQPGLRAVPSLRYLQAAPVFTEHFYDSEDEGDESVDNGPTGGLTWDGRADHGKDQARIPLLSPFEMGNKDEAQVVAALRRAPYADAFKAAFGADVLDHPQDAFDAAVEALGTFEQSSTDFYPYSSRYDAFLAGKATLTAQELHGRALFEDEAKGNCASCHLSEPANDGTVHKFDDLPKAYWGNLNTDPPFNGRKLGDRPALTDAEIDDIVAFLGTLTDADQAGR
ncbi:cytochrome c peroxidase [Mesorhizobium sp.]|uniref:cytochrome-c peroxidase n=1 Tax=Mesorhizobium sp. TaxID=1871066 RepID=UPI0025E940D7|nr:cytochrome c peroxidase [Mesorhizobium sp.]